jgi:excisionase family DNA binding protein
VNHSTHTRTLGEKSAPPGGGLLLSPEQLSEYLGIPLASIYRWRACRTGPRGIRVGRHVRYRITDIETWLDQQTDPKPA